MPHPLPWVRVRLSPLPTARWVPSLLHSYLPLYTYLSLPLPALYFTCLPHVCTLAPPRFTRSTRMPLPFVPGVALLYVLRCYAHTTRLPGSFLPTAHTGSTPLPAPPPRARAAALSRDARMRTYRRSRCVLVIAICGSLPYMCPSPTTTTFTFTPRAPAAFCFFVASFALPVPAIHRFAAPRYRVRTARTRIRAHARLPPTPR